MNIIANAILLIKRERYGSKDAEHLRKLEHGGRGLFTSEKFRYTSGVVASPFGNSEQDRSHLTPSRLSMLFESSRNPRTCLDISAKHKLCEISQDRLVN